MSLGYARDSLADLRSLLHDDYDTSDGFTLNRLAGQIRADPSKITVKYSDTNSENGEEFLFLDDGNELPTSIPGVMQPVMKPTRTDSDATTTRLSNVGISSGKHSQNGAKEDTIESKQKEVISYDHAYNNFEYDYSAYADYYTAYDFTANEKSNEGIFCCFFPGKTKSDDDSDDSSSNDDSVKNCESVTPALDDTKISNMAVGQASTSGAKSDTTDGIEASSHGSGVPKTASSQLEETKNDVSTPKLLIENITDVGVTKPKVSPPNPKQLQVQRTDSFSTAQSIPSTFSPSKSNKENENENEAATNAVVAVTTKTPATTTNIFKKKIPIADAVPLKGILKKNNSATKLATYDVNGSEKENIHSMHDNVDDKSRRNLFPTYQIRHTVDSVVLGSDSSYNTCSEEKPKKNVKFKPMSRVVTVKSRSYMSFIEKCQIWWQKPDYDDFKKTARLIAKAMIEGGSQIWLQSSKSWDKQKQKQLNRGKVKDNHTSIENPAYRNALKKYGVEVKDSDDSSDGSEDDMESSGDKWWCKFGHSRRGLEHIVAPEEGRQRHKYVTNATQAVLNEQRRQRLTKRDPQKIAAVSKKHTAWARELAFAAAAADDEAVRSKFCTNAKSRLSHLQENLRLMEKMREKGRGASEYMGAHFVLNANPVLTSMILDENTHSSISLRAKKSEATNKTREHALCINQMRRLNEYHINYHGESKEVDIMKTASGFGSTQNETLLLRYT